MSNGTKIAPISVIVLIVTLTITKTAGGLKALKGEGEKSPEPLLVKSYNRICQNCKGSKKPLAFPRSRFKHSSTARWVQGLKIITLPSLVSHSLCVSDCLPRDRLFIAAPGSYIQAQQKRYSSLNPRTNQIVRIEPTVETPSVSQRRFCSVV